MTVPFVYCKLSSPSLRICTGAAAIYPLSVLNRN